MGEADGEFPFGKADGGEFPLGEADGGFLVEIDATVKHMTVSKLKRVTLFFNIIVEFYPYWIKH